MTFGDGGKKENKNKCKKTVKVVLKQFLQFLCVKICFIIKEVKV